MVKRPVMSVVIHVVPPDVALAEARRHEAAGWDGIGLVDSQCIAGDVYAQLAAIARATERIEIGTWVTNTLTRHPAATASAIGTVDLYSNGRAYLGVGRGDSSLAHLGAAPVSVEQFLRYVQTTRDYLAGRGVPLDEARSWLKDARPVTDLAIAHAPDESRIVWRGASPRVVPVDVVASGPRMIRLGAVQGDRVTLAVGADVERLRLAVGLARSARTQAGLDPDSRSIGALITLAPLADLPRARALCAGAVAAQARFAAMFGPGQGDIHDQDRAVIEGVSKSYDMDRHGGQGTQLGALTDEFIDRFAVLGAPSACVDRLHEIAELGIDRISVVASGTGCDPTLVEASYHAIVDQVLPSL